MRAGPKGDWSDRVFATVQIMTAGAARTLAESNDLSTIAGVISRQLDVPI